MSLHNRWKLVLIIYVFTLHLVLVALIVKTDFIPRLQSKLGSIWDVPNEHFKIMLEFHKWMDGSVPNDAIIFLGDSITQGLATAAVAPHTINYGIGSENTAELLIALPEHRSLSRSSVIVLTIGINDIGQGRKEGLDDRYKKIIDALPQKQPLLWNAVMPARDRKVNLREIREANRTIKTLCENRMNCTFLNTWEFLTDGNGQMDNKFFLDDGLHLSPEGYGAWINALNQAIQTISAAKAQLAPSNDPR